MSIPSLRQSSKLLFLSFLLADKKVLMSLCVHRSISTGSYVDMLQQITIALTSTSSQWKKELLINITLAMQEQVTSLLETVKQMDSALQRRAKNRTTANTDATSTTNMSDSEKIFLQVKLDVIAYGEEMKHLGIDPQDISAYVTLLQDVSTQV